jgi:hypothetical protein
MILQGKEKNLLVSNLTQYLLKSGGTYPEATASASQPGIYPRGSEPSNARFGVNQFYRGGLQTLRRDHTGCHSRLLLYLVLKRGKLVYMGAIIGCMILAGLLALPLSSGAQEHSY